MFEQNQSLIHVDMSFNGIKQEDCKVIAEGLCKNHHILGLHFQGNMGSIDANGFLKEGIPDHFGEFGNPRPMQK